MNMFDMRPSFAQRIRDKFSYANVTSSLAVLLALMGSAYANHLLVLSSDIVDGEVKTADLGSSAVTAAKIASSAVTSAKLGSGAVTNAKLSATAVTGAKTVDNSLTGADIDETTLESLNAVTLDGYEREALVRIGGTHVNTSAPISACPAGAAYVAKTITVPWPGSVLVQGSFTAGATTSTPLGFAARIERTSAPVVIGTWHEDHVPNPSGRANVAVMEVVQVSAGTHTFIMRVCGSSTIVSIGGHLSFVYTINPQL
jgi:hypothetical protein